MVVSASDDKEARNTAKDEGDDDEEEVPQSLCVDAGLRMPETARCIACQRILPSMYRKYKSIFIAGLVASSSVPVGLHTVGEAAKRPSASPRHQVRYL